MAWTKVCRLGFQDLMVHHGEFSEWRIYPASNDSNAAAPPLLDADGILEDVTKLQLSAPEGAVRLQVPTIGSSDEKLLKVDIRGATMTLNQGDQFLEVGSEPTEISVIYTCEGTGVAEVELGLWHAVVTPAHAAEGLHLHWRKQCGEATYKFMDIFLKSDLNMTKVQAVSHGRALPGFEPRCRNQSKSSHPAVDGTSPKAASQTCGSQPPALEVSPREAKTSVELRVDPEGLALPPALQHQPDLSFDQRIVKAYVSRMPDPFVRGRAKVPCTNCQESSLRSSTVKAASQTMIVKYSCHKQGVSPIMVTVYVAKPSWQIVLNFPLVAFMGDYKKSHAS